MVGVPEAATITNAADVCVGLVKGKCQGRGGISASQKSEGLSQLIVHTDRGVHYTSDAYKNYLEHWGVRHSMAHYAWQNAYCERVHRTIKHNYLNQYTTDSYNSLSKGVAKAVSLYNLSKPHRGLPSRLSPDQFVKELNQGSHPDYRVNILVEVNFDQNVTCELKTSTIFRNLQLRV